MTDIKVETRRWRVFDVASTRHAGGASLMWQAQDAPPARLYIDIRRWA